MNIDLKKRFLEQLPVPRVLHLVAFNRRFVGSADAPAAAGQSKPEA